MSFPFTSPPSLPSLTKPSSGAFNHPSNGLHAADTYPPSVRCHVSSPIRSVCTTLRPRTAEPCFTNRNHTLSQLKATRYIIKRTFVDSSRPLAALIEHKIHVFLHFPHPCNLASNIHTQQTKWQPSIPPTSLPHTPSQRPTSPPV